MLRIHFTGEDLAKVRLAGKPTALWETALTLFRFHRDGMASGSDQRGLSAPASSPRCTSVSASTPVGQFPDVLLADPITLPADGDGEALAWLGQTLGQRHRSVVASYWDQAMAHVEADRAKRARAWLDGGCEGLLNSYRPLMRWQYPVLEVDFAIEQDVHLQSRGLLLVPSYFRWGMPDTVFDPELVPMLVYPVGRDLRRAESVDSEGNAESLAALIGSTRAWVLGAIEEGCTTSELARRVGINASSVSQHTTVLREARLIQSNRIGKAMLHTLTPLGISLLQGT